MIKSHFMSPQEIKITLPILVEPLRVLPIKIEPIPATARADPDAARMRIGGSVGADHVRLDPWELRSSLLKWPIDDWCAFFEQAGGFGAFTLEITREDFREWQELLTEAMIAPPRDWDGLKTKFEARKVDALTKPKEIRFEWHLSPVARLTTTNALDAVIATIQLEKVQGAEFRRCARPDCKNPPFKVGARHKIYCSEPCAHVEAVRAHRKRDVEAKGRSASRVAKRKSGKKGRA